MYLYGNLQDTNNDSIISPGDTIIYSIYLQVSNVSIGNAIFTDSLTNFMYDSSQYVIQPGYHVYNGPIYTINQADIDFGYVYNSVFLNGNTISPFQQISISSIDDVICPFCPIDPLCPNCTVTPLVSYPTGNNNVQGNIKYDFNSNGCDINDFDFSNLNFSFSSSNITFSFYPNTNGHFITYLNDGLYSITPNLENSTYFNISPTNFIVDFPSQASPFTQDFCVTANGVHSDVEIMIVPTTSARPGFDANYKLVYRNKGNQVENGSISLTFDDSVLDYLSSNPIYNSLATNSFIWNYTNLQPFETREIEISFNVNSPMESPAVNNGDILNYTATITTANTDETPVDNTFTLNQTVVGSYDPNDKTCLEGEYVSSNVVGKYVHYVIRFENTGTYPAENIVVKDMIDISKFDISTLVPLHGSHEFYTRIKDNKVEFIFENINLDFNDATNDGYVAFKIKTLPTLNIGDSFSNNANIYFDYNFPITTNTYNTTINNVLNNQDFVFENEFVLYPNPANEIINISTKNQTEINSVEIYNLVGQIVLAIPNTTNKIDVSNLETGTYFIKVNTEKGSTTTKFVKE
ncbi:conserved repeat domain-containing protein/Por secretion system C-terminal sorting domain-containing protein [Flavobacterium haoranii]|uniref:Conserved repeat domain-containing protein/Por secretion system C-terminal sorting domain-containing protein n=2 Tax=Flavobacterium haoranii TaxID=683124 RepID=A0A1M6HYZ4_9FLAO|nr:conserved repeat domain-containing protein/Por secretion system C-terminal sorting domain-containing protein [Flavobacterium haoranii]